MCGPEFTNKPRGGALAALSSPIDADRLRSLCADLAFHTPGHPESNEATHARLTPDAEYDSSILSDLHIVIHSSGDLSRKPEECGTFQQFRFPAAPNSCNTSFIELPLDKPLSLEVGNDGIIGRRVSLYSRSVPTRLVAEGIVGFNFLSRAQPCL
ncbi:hypothetical protein TGAM01_v210264 [Trichoderma gamsii]|uniref:Uncharacterized protein n=1 Tax=Trichoderma gamsii TaxID=398673 RepID=A0A0W7VCJ2_9HYPO|nr:hypothetical protein TGAM01_v210264 [Trichoderma gamsii]PNP40067.1 hypothetical protein TGAMA5MH_07989 [Trichoderma gamsii]PON20865.1 hypothetical protein TGAM01_v210264 [Trichoderma gamsii]